MRSNGAATSRSRSISTARGAPWEAHCDEAARRAGAKNGWRLIDRLLRKGALDRIRPAELLLAMLRPSGPRGFLSCRHRDLLAAIKARRLELAIAAIDAVDRLRPEENTVLRASIVVGNEREAIAEFLGQSIYVVDKRLAAICQAHRVTRSFHATHDVFRLACGIHLPRYMHAFHSGASAFVNREFSYS